MVAYERDCWWNSYVIRSHAWGGDYDYKIQNNINNLLILLDKMDRKINSKTHQKQLIEKITLEKNNLQKTYDHSLVEANDVENILEIFRMSSLSSR